MMPKTTVPAPSHDFDHEKPGGKNHKLNFYIVLTFFLACFFIFLAVAIKEIIKPLNNHGYRLKIITQQLIQTQKELQILKQQIIHVQEKIQPTFWQVTLANYLIHLAYYSSYYLYNLPKSIELLQQADQVLKPLALLDHSITEIRQHLAEVNTELQSLTPINQAKLLTQLMGLQCQVTQMPLNSSKNPSTQISFPADAHSHQPTTWKTRLYESLQSLKESIVIRHPNDQGEEDYSSIASIGGGRHSSYWLRQTIYWLLQKTQWALLNGQTKIYYSSLDQVISLIQAYFDLNHPTTQAFLKSINQVKQVDLKPVLPDFKPLLRLSEQKVALFQKLNDTSYSN